jgi:hypothetical protein
MARDSQKSTTTIAHTTMVDHDVTTATKRIPLLPVEIWLHILEYDNPKHLWLSVRNVSRMYRACVERLFTSQYLSSLSIALSLPRRDHATGKMRWRGDPIPGSQLKMEYSRLSADGQRLYLESSVVVKDRFNEKSVEELRNAGILPKERLEEAPAYISLSTHSFAGVTVNMPVQVGWSEARKIWIWEIKWRNLLSQFYDGKEKQSKRWHKAARDVVPHGVHTRWPVWERHSSN